MLGNPTYFQEEFQHLPLEHEKIVNHTSGQNHNYKKLIIRYYNEGT